MERLSEHVWRYQDETEATSYLIVGSEKAAMIDCGTGLAPIMPEIRKITEKPVMLLLTHGHPDHYGAAREFEEIRVHEKDLETGKWFTENYPAINAPAFPADRAKTFADDAMFDLGDRHIRVMPLPGHTPGSVVFADDADRMAFFGDAIGSGSIVLMSVTKALPLDEYLISLRTFATRMDSIADYAWHGGHYTQAGIPGTPEYNPIRPQTVRDMAVLCEKILSGKMEGETVPEPNSPTGYAQRAFLGAAGIIYL